MWSATTKVLDPEPELFALATAHLFGRAGYEANGSPMASPLKRVAVVGVGRHPGSFRAIDGGQRSPKGASHWGQPFKKGASEYEYAIKSMPRIH